MVKRFYSVVGLVGLVCMLAGVMTTYMALGQDNTEPEAPAAVTEMVTLTATPSPTATLIPTDIPLPTLAPTLEPPTVVPPTQVPVEAAAPVVEVTAEILPPAVEPTVALDVQPTQTVEQTAQPLAEATELVAPIQPTSDPALIATVTLDPMLEVTATVDSMVAVTATLDPALTVPAGAPTVLPPNMTALPPALPASPGVGARPVSAMPMPPTQPGVIATVEFTPSAVETLAMPSNTAEAPTLVAPTEMAISQPTMAATVAATATLMPTAQPVGQISGLVTFEHMPTHAGIRLTLLLPDGSSANAVSDDQGRFAFANLLPGAYRLEASAHGFLTRHIEFTLSEGQQVELPAGLLKAGDTNEDNVIDLRDITLIAANFNGPAQVLETDINGDGWVDIRDLSLVGALFGTSGPLPWN